MLPHTSHRIVTMTTTFFTMVKVRKESVPLLIIAILKAVTNLGETFTSPLTTMNLFSLLRDKDYIFSVDEYNNGAASLP